MTQDLQAESLEASLTVADLEPSVRWYCETLGFTVDRRHERDGRLMAASLRAGAVRILLNQDDGARGTDRPKGEGFSLQITTSQSADAIAARIVERGYPLETAPTTAPWGVRILRVRDPDGFRWNISSTYAGQDAPGTAPQLLSDRPQARIAPT